MEYHSVAKGNELSSHEKIQRNLKCITLSEIIQSEKATYCNANYTVHGVAELDTTEMT